MAEIDYAAMDAGKLKRHMLTHRTAQKAFYAYIDRRHSLPSNVFMEPDDPAWKEKLIAAIEAQINRDR